MMKETDDLETRMTGNMTAVIDVVGMHMTTGKGKIETLGNIQDAHGQGVDPLEGEIGTEGIQRRGWRMAIEGASA